MSHPIVFWHNGVASWLKGERKWICMGEIFGICKPYLKKYMALLGLYIGISIFVSLFSLVTPTITGSFIDQLVRNSNASFLYRYCAVFAAISLGQILLGYVSGRMYIRLQMSMGFAFNRDMVQHVHKVSLKHIEKQDPAYLSQRINNDTNNLVIFCISVIQNIIINAMTILFPFAILYYYNHQIAWIVLAMTVFYLLVYRFTKKPLYGANLKYQEAQSCFFGKLNEQIDMAKFIKVHAILNIFIQRLENSFQQFLAVALHRQNVSYLFSGLDGTIAALMQICLFLIGGFAVLQKSLSVGQFTVVSTYFSMLLSSARYFLGLGKSIQENRVAYTRTREIQKIPEQTNGQEMLDQIRAIRMENVAFSYGERWVFQDYNLELHAGKMYGISGINGSGKTTLISLLLGLYVSDHKGGIYYNDRPLGDLDMIELRQKKIGVAEQEPTLVADTLEYNLSLGNEKVDQNQFQFLAEKLGLTHYMDHLHQGLQTEINSGSDNLSGGEKQKLAIIRALLKDPDVLVLDEPTSAMDVQSRSSFLQYLNEIKKGKIIVIVTHDADVLKACDANISL